MELLDSWEWGGWIFCEPVCEFLEWKCAATDVCSDPVNPIRRVCMAVFFIAGQSVIIDVNMQFSEHVVEFI